MIARSKQIVKIDYFVELHYAFETGRVPSLLNNRLKTPEKKVCLTGQPVRRRILPVLSPEKEDELMSDFELLMIVLTIGLLIAAVLNIRNK